MDKDLVMSPSSFDFTFNFQNSYSTYLKDKNTTRMQSCRTNLSLNLHAEITMAVWMITTTSQCLTTATMAIKGQSSTLMLKHCCDVIHLFQ